MERKLIRLISFTSIIFMFYGLIVLSVIGPFHLFNFFYPVSGLILFVFARFYERLKEKPRRILLSLLMACALIFLSVEAKIVTFALQKPEPQADYVIVLGSQVTEKGPSRDYKARLDSALEYLQANPQTRIICTGGQGTYEPMSEAQGAYEYLCSKAIAKDRILKEDKSTNTVENLSNAKKLIAEDDKVVIVSGDYHLYRASFIAKKIGLLNASYKGGHGMLILLPQYYTREFFALIKEYMTL